jgi:hypothetical protein
MKDLIDYSRQTTSGPIGATLASSPSYCLCIVICITICFSHEERGYFLFPSDKPASTEHALISNILYYYNILLGTVFFLPLASLAS